MYFIISGGVEVRLPSGPVHLGAGDFFGEIALLTESNRTATVVAGTSCQLLVLRVADFRRILAAHDDLRAVISRVAHERLAISASPPKEGAADENGTAGHEIVDESREPAGREDE